MADTDKEIKGTINCYLYKRIGKASVNAEKNGYYSPGDEVTIKDVVLGDTKYDYFEGIPTWYKLNNGLFIWSGGVDVDTESRVFEERYEIESSLNIIDDSPIEVGSEEMFKALTDYKYRKYSEEKEDMKLEWWHKQFNIPEIWKKYDTLGEYARVVILDSGLKHNHSYFNKDLINGMNFLVDEGDKDLLNYNDSDGHGTGVAGIISGYGDKYIGIAPNAQIWMAKFYSSKTKSKLIPEKILQALKYLQKYKNEIDIISISYGILESEVQDQLLEVINDLSKTCILVCSAGNDGNASLLNRYPASCLESLSVGFSKQNSLVSKDSNKSNYLSLLGPGENIKVLSRYKDDYFIVESGSSYSTPFVSGVLALLIGHMRKNKITYNVDSIKKQLLESCTKVKNQNKLLYGEGIINPLEFFEKVKKHI